MRNLIDKDDTLKIIADTISLYGTGTKVESEILNIVSKIPSAEPKTGKWVFKRLYHEADECICSECGQLMTTAHEKRMRFCPNCGATMEGEEG